MLLSDPTPEINALIGDMFAAIDAKDIGSLPQFFAPNILYERPGFPDINGLDDLLDFYTHRRIIRSGAHRVFRLICTTDGAIAEGVFSGVLKDGTRAHERFADAYTLKDGLILKRTTYFFRQAI